MNFVKTILSLNLSFQDLSMSLNKEYQEGACGENALFSVRRM